MTLSYGNTGMVTMSPHSQAVTQPTLISKCQLVALGGRWVWRYGGEREEDRRTWSAPCLTPHSRPSHCPGKMVSAVLTTVAILAIIAGVTRAEDQGGLLSLCYALHYAISTVHFTVNEHPSVRKQNIESYFHE